MENDFYTIKYGVFLSFTESKKNNISNSNDAVKINKILQLEFYREVGKKSQFTIYLCVFSLLLFNCCANTRLQVILLTSHTILYAV